MPLMYNVAPELRLSVVFVEYARDRRLETPLQKVKELLCLQNFSSRAKQNGGKRKSYPNHSHYTSGPLSNFW